MPGFDGTGPMGQGSMTGRGMGYCAVPVNQPVSALGPVAPATTPYYPAAAYPPAVVSVAEEAAVEAAAAGGGNSRQAERRYDAWRRWNWSTW
jgi:hypothetical protein